MEIQVNETYIVDSNKVNIYRLVQLWIGHIIQRRVLVSVLVIISEIDDFQILQITDEVDEAQTYTDYLSHNLMPIKERLNLIGGTWTLQQSMDNKCFTITFSLKK